MSLLCFLCIGITFVLAMYVICINVRFAFCANNGLELLVGVLPVPFIPPFKSEISQIDPAVFKVDWITLVGWSVDLFRKMLGGW